MPANDGHGTSLRTLLSLLFDETYLRTHLKLIEVSVEHAIVVEVNLAPVGCLQEAIVGKELRDPAMMLGRVALNGPTKLAHMVFKLATRSVKCFAYRLRQLFLRLVVSDQLAARDGKPDTHYEWSALAMMRDCGCLYRDLTTADPFIIRIERHSIFVDLSFDHLGQGKIA
jgi:hypothetical protein